MGIYGGEKIAFWVSKALRFLDLAAPPPAHAVQSLGGRTHGRMGKGVLLVPAVVAAVGNIVVLMLPVVYTSSALNGMPGSGREGENNEEPARRQCSRLAATMK